MLLTSQCLSHDLQDNSRGGSSLIRCFQKQDLEHCRASFQHPMHDAQRQSCRKRTSHHISCTAVLHDSSRMVACRATVSTADAPFLTPSVQVGAGGAGDGLGVGGALHTRLVQTAAPWQSQFAAQAWPTLHAAPQPPPPLHETIWGRAAAHQKIVEEHGLPDVDTLVLLRVYSS
jgi:hypothetical protein